jgi:hypothetical protein
VFDRVRLCLTRIPFEHSFSIYTTFFGEKRQDWARRRLAQSASRSRPPKIRGSRLRSPARESSRSTPTPNAPRRIADRVRGFEMAENASDMSTPFSSSGVPATQ